MDIVISNPKSSFLFFFRKIFFSYHISNAWHGMAGRAWNGMAWHKRHDRNGMACHGMTWCGMAWHKMACMAWHGTQPWHGMADRHVKAWHGIACMAWNGMTGMACQGMASRYGR